VNIQLRQVIKRYQKVRALQKVSLDIASGEITALLGPSGSGKTTLLRLIAGLELPHKGSILFDGRDQTTVPVRERKVGFVFQNYALFKHLTVFENVAFGLRILPWSKRPGRRQIENTVRDLLMLVQLGDYGDRLPSQLSGGQRQRIALARALAIEPRVLLLDEPFGALDARVRRDLRRWLRELHERLHVTSVLVTHDQEEALELADQVVIMNNGRVVQTGTPETVYSAPATAFVYDFLGDANRLRGTVTADGIAVGNLVLPVPIPQGATHDVLVHIRPHQLSLGTDTSHSTAMAAEVLDVNATGPVVRIEARTPFGADLAIQTTHEELHARPVSRGSQITVGFRLSDVFVVPADAALSTVPRAAAAQVTGASLNSADLAPSHPAA
jgi:sulfate transport system ATP-binding protein